MASKSENETRGEHVTLQLTQGVVVLLLACAWLVVGSATATAAGQDEVVAVRSSAEVSKLLSSRNPSQRREAAEELARAAAVEHRRLVEGYRLQEKDARVRLALDWALYRMGKTQALFPVVNDLDTSRAEQAVAYLGGLDSPDPLYPFFGHLNGKKQIRLLEVLARVGDAGTLERLKPFYESPDPVIVDAARFAEREITIRLEETPTPEPKRPRQTGRRDEDEP